MKSRALAAVSISTLVLVAAATSHSQAPGSASRPATVIELQNFRRTTRIEAIGRGTQHGTATLINLNPTINSWFVLELDWAGGSEFYHIENATPQSQEIGLAQADPHGLQLIMKGQTTTCGLWGDGTTPLGEQVQHARQAYIPLCEGRLYLLKQIAGSATPLEYVTDLLRKHVLGGESIINLVRRGFFQDRFLERGLPGAVSGSVADVSDGPVQAMLDPATPLEALIPEHLDIALSASSLTIGHWYAANGAPGVYVSVIRPNAIAPAILSANRQRVNRLDAAETMAIAYLVAFDLADFDLGFAVGTEHPGVGWSNRTPEAMREAMVAGPDGIDSVTPLVRTGTLGPRDAALAAATFAAGFKRDHGAFLYGSLAKQNYASHYGFIQNGVVLSKLQPGLATLFTLDDGRVEMKTWQAGDNALLSRIRYARQNGVALIEHDAAANTSEPGLLVNQWGAGNWSGSMTGELRALRSGICLQIAGARRFLIYGYFSDATPSAMARVFQAYGCRYAMHLDMNALEHTYLALYLRTGSGVAVEHLIRAMEEVDLVKDGALVPRFLGASDNRDFFFLTRRVKQ